VEETTGGGVDSNDECSWAEGSGSWMGETRGGRAGGDEARRGEETRAEETKGGAGGWMDERGSGRVQRVAGGVGGRREEDGCRCEWGVAGGWRSEEDGGVGREARERGRFRAQEAKTRRLRSQLPHMQAEQKNNNTVIYTRGIHAYCFDLIQNRLTGR